MLLEVDERGRTALHYGAMSKHTWCFKTRELLFKIEKTPEIEVFYRHYNEI